MTEAPKPAAPPKPLGHERNSQVLWTRIRKRPAALISVAYTVPVFLAYQLGILWLDRHGKHGHPDEVERSGFDLVSSWMLRLIDASVPAYVLLTLALALVLLVTTWVYQKRGKIAESPHKRVFWEALSAAVIGLAVLSYISHRVLQGEASNISSLPVLDRVILAIGSGFHEELVFRGLLISGGSWALMKFGKVRKQYLALAICTVASSALYSLTHFFLIGGDTFSVAVAMFRVVEAVFFAALYLSRGFAVAVYTHTFYNLFTLLWYF